MDDRQLIADLLSALEYHTEQTRPIEFSKVAIEAAREYLRKPAQEPVATVTNESGNPDVTMSWWHEPALPVDTKFYTSPPQRKPLRSYEIAQILDRERMKWNKSPPTHEFDLAFVRAIEAAHGIGGEA